jgi:hypothetical protein
MVKICESRVDDCFGASARWWELIGPSSARLGLWCARKYVWGVYRLSRLGALYVGILGFHMRALSVPVLGGR